MIIINYKEGLFMKINSITPMIVNTSTRKKIYNTPSFGEKACLSKDEFQLSVLSLVNNNPKELLKEVKKARKNIYTGALFNAVMESRKEELLLKQKAEEKAKIEYEIKNAHHMAQCAGLTSSNAYYLNRAVTNRINDLKSILEKYDKYKPADENKLKILAKVAKVLVKKEGFNPNEKDYFGHTLIERAIYNDDDELALMIIKHKKFKRPTEIQLTSYDWRKFLELEKRAKSWF